MCMNVHHSFSRNFLFYICSRTLAVMWLMTLPSPIFCPSLPTCMAVCLNSALLPIVVFLWVFYPSICTFVYPSTFLSFCAFVPPSIWPFIHLPVRFSVHPSVCTLFFTSLLLDFILFFAFCTKLSTLRGLIFTWIDFRGFRRFSKNPRKLIHAKY